MLYSIIIGAFCGWIASMIMNTNEQMGAIKNILAGVIGGAVGNFALGLLGLQSKGGLVGSIVSGILGACIVIFIIKAITRR